MRCGDLCREFDLRVIMTELIRGAIASVDEDERRAVLPRPTWRVNTADFGPQNLLVTSDGSSPWSTSRPQAGTTRRDS